MEGFISTAPLGKLYLLEKIETLLQLDTQEQHFINSQDDDTGTVTYHYDPSTRELVTNAFVNHEVVITRETFTHYILAKLNPLIVCYIEDFTKILEDMVLKGGDGSRFCELQSGMLKNLISKLELQKKSSAYPSVFSAINDLEATLLARFPYFVPRTSYPTVKQLYWTEGAMDFAQTFTSFIFNKKLIMNGKAEHTTIAGELYRFFDFPRVKENSFKKYFKDAMDKERDNSKSK